MKQSLFFLLLVSTSFLQAQPLDTSAVLKKIDSLVQVNRTLADQKKYDEAFIAIEAAKKLTLETIGKEHWMWANCLFNHGRVFDLMEQHTEAEPLYLQAKSLFEKTRGKEDFTYTSCLYNLAKLYADEGRYLEAEPLYLSCIQIRAKILGKNDPRYGSAVTNISALYLRMHEYERAEPFCREAAAIDKQNIEKSPKHYASSLTNLAIAYRHLARFEQADACLQEARQLYEKRIGTSAADYMTVLYTQGQMRGQAGDYKAAEQLYIEAKTHAEKTFGKNHTRYIDCANALAILYWELGLYDPAEQGYLEVKYLQEQAGQTEDIDFARTLVNLGLLYFTMSEFKRAEPLLLEAKALFENKIKNFEHPFYFNCLNNLAGVYRFTNRLEQSEALHRQAVSLSKQKFGSIASYEHSVSNLAAVCADRGKYQEAEALFLEAKADYEKTLGKSHVYYRNTLHSIIRLYWLQGRIADAETYLNELNASEKHALQQASKHLSEIEMMAYSKKFARQVERSFSFAQAFPSPVWTERAFDNALFFKGFHLYALSRLRTRANKDTASAQLFDRFISYRRRLADAYAKPLAAQKGVAELEAQANAVEKELARSVAGLEEARREVRWREVQAALQPGEAAVEFIHFNYRRPDLTDSVLYVALVLKREGPPAWVYLFEEKQLKTRLYAEQTPDLINRFYQSPRLYQLIWQPLEPYLKGIRHVYYSPSGQLWRIAFPALQDLQQRPLAQRFALHCLGSVRQLTFPSTPSEFTPAGEATLFGGIQYDMDSTAFSVANIEYAKPNDPERFSSGNLRGAAGATAWESLQWSDPEVNGISTMLTHAQAKPIVRKGLAASEEAFYQLGKRGASPRTLHLSTHAFYFPEKTLERKSSLEKEPAFKISEHPMMRSGLIMAGANRVWTGGHALKNMEDGILTAYEISQSDLSGTELAVLSACETGRGYIETSEGVYGLQRAFKIAGVRYLLVSLWPVSDFQTEQLMIAFYSEWLRGGLSIPAAFRNAQLKLAAQAPNEVFTWAGFVLVE